VDFREIVWGRCYGVDSGASVQGLVASTCEHGDELLGSGASEFVS
jgi:hypothetical protein